MNSWDEESLISSDINAEKPAKRNRERAPEGAKRKKFKDNDSFKKRKKKKNESIKPPTIEELNDLKVTENLYNNNLFRLQIEELIKEVNIKNKRRKALSSWLEKFQNTMSNLPQMDDVLLSEITQATTLKKMSPREKFLSTLNSDYECKLKTDQDLSLKFEKPSYLECFGLYENKCFVGPNLEACINVQMPKACFHVKDFLNNRYLVKRFYYLAYISKHLTVYKKSFELHENNILLPLLLIQPSEDEKLTVKIYITPPPEYFKPSRFLPGPNNIKQDLFEDGIKDLEILRSTPTILYNSVLAHDVTLKENHNFVKATLEGHENVLEGIKLLWVWLKQRQMDFGYGGFTPNLTMYLVAYLLVKKKINKLMSSYQVIRNFWSFIATNDFVISFGDASEKILELFKKHFSLIFIDKSGCLNLAAFLDLNVFGKVKLECELAMKHLDECRVESFQFLFLTKLPFPLQYDMLLDVTESLPLKDQFICTDGEKAKYIGFDQFQALTRLSDLAKKGLNKRAINIVPHIDVKYPGSINKAFFGINLNPETAFSFIEMGPALNDYAKADEFRKFWGYLSSDRRFRDGSTHVAIYFRTSTMRGKRAIVKRIIKYLLVEKLDLKFKLYYDEFEEFLLSKKVTSPYPQGTNEDACLKIITLADELGQKLRSAKMSLSISGIQGQSDAFSYSAVFPPIACCHKPEDKKKTEVKGKNVIFSNKEIEAIPRFVEPVELVLQLEHSSKWPNNLEAIWHLKTSFYLEIARMLETTYKLITNITKDYLDVFYEGLVFRYRLYVPKEVGLMKKQVAEGGVITYTENAESVAYEKTLNVLPKINAALKGLQLQFPSFGPGTALAKRWLRSHLVDDFHFPDVAVNLLNASMYTNSTSFAESCTPQISFLRFLQFVSEFRWEVQPVLVNFNESISKEDISDLESSFQQNREAVQPLYIITPYDQGQSLFTKMNPSKEILHRTRQLAEASLSLILGRIEGQIVFELKDLFKPNMEGYNVLIYLSAPLNPRRHEQIGAEEDTHVVLDKYKSHPSEKIPITGFNPVELYLKCLRENYGDFATFFHDPYGGSVVGVLWNPKAREPREFKVSHACGRKLLDKKLVLNEDAIIEDFYILGKGLVKWIERKC